MTYSIHQLIRNSQLNKLDVKLILRHVLNFTPAQLITRDEYILSQTELEQFEKLSYQLQQGVPTHYLLGYREFYSRSFKVSSDTLIPRPETEFLVDALLAVAKPGLQLLDLGTGSGCVAISAKLECPGLLVTAVDKYPATLGIACENSLELGADIELYLSDWFSEVKGKYDIIVSNPPYIHPNDYHLAALCYEPRAALTDYNDGLDCLRHIIATAPNYLNKHGYLMVEHGFDQGILVRELFITTGFSEVCTIKDYSDNDRITIGKQYE